jgi:hypothetical protein
MGVHVGLRGATGYRLELSNALKTRPFSDRGEGCRLNIVRNRLATWVLAVLPMMQLVLGMQWQAAHANVAAPALHASGVDTQHCPDHLSKASRTGQRRDAGASASVSSSHDSPVHYHDCCGSLDCQCHGAQGPGLLGVPMAGAVGPPSFLPPPFFDARPPVARTNEFFRPPIA